MTAWWTGECVPFDLETDGTDPLDARIITACVGEIRKDEQGSAIPPNVQNWMAQPERDIPEGAAAVHGISTEHAREHGHPREVVVSQVAAALAYGSADREGLWARLPVVGHNIAYDLTVLDREMRRLDVGRLVVDHFNDIDGIEASSVLVKMRGEPVGAFYTIDTMVLDKAIDPYRPGPRDPKTGEKLGGRNRLTTVAEHYGVPIRGDAHAADADAMASARIAWAIAKRCAMAAEVMDDAWETAKPTDQYEIHRLYADRRKPLELIHSFATLGTLSLSELHDWQRRMAREQAASFRQYCIENPKYVEEKGTDVGGIDGSWPIRPMTNPAKTETVATVADGIL